MLLVLLLLIPPQVWGNASGGLCDELRLKSVPATADTNASHINLRAHGGSLDFENTKVRKCLLLYLSGNIYQAIVYTCFSVPCKIPGYNIPFITVPHDTQPVPVPKHMPPRGV